MIPNKNIIVIQSPGGSTNSRQDILNYLASNTVITGSYTDYRTATFNKGWAIAPSDFPPNSTDQFQFYVNGSSVEFEAIQSFTSSLSSSILVIDPEVLQYELEYGDTIISIGKFL
jgi:hypothetical protein